MTPYRYVLFDLDGTLTDPGAGIIRTMVHALASVGHAVDDHDSLRPLIGPPLTDGFASLGLAPDQVQAAIVAYRERYAEAGMYENALIPGIDALLADLVADGVRLAVATAKAEPFARAIVEHFGIDRHFVAVAGASLDLRRAHKDEVILHALEHLALPDPSSVVMVGDREHDVYGASEHGVAAIGVLWGYGSRQELASAGAKQIVGSLDELRRVLR